MIYTNEYESPLGSILLAGDEQGLTGLWFTQGARYTGLGLKKGARRCETDYFDQTKQWLDIYFSGRDPGFFPRIHLTGSDFRNRVGEIMCGIPFGKTVTYGWIADKLAKERGLDQMSAQAVGGAVVGEVRLESGALLFQFGDGGAQLGALLALRFEVTEAVQKLELARRDQ